MTTSTSFHHVHAIAGSGEEEEQVVFSFLTRGNYPFCQNITFIMHFCHWTCPKQNGKVTLKLDWYLTILLACNPVTSVTLTLRQRSPILLKLVLPCWTYISWKFEVSWTIPSKIRKLFQISIQTPKTKAQISHEMLKISLSNFQLPLD